MKKIFNKKNKRSNNKMKEKVILFSAKSSNRLAHKIFRELEQKLPEKYELSFGRTDLNNYKDGEQRYRPINKLEGNNVIIIGCGCDPVEINTFEMLGLCRSASKCGAKRIIFVPTLFPFRREDKATDPKDFQKCITLEMVCEWIVSAGASDIISLELHNPDLVKKSCEPAPVHNILIDDLILKTINKLQITDYALIAADKMGRERINELIKKTEVPIVRMDKYRPINDVARTTNAYFETTVEKIPEIAIVKEDELNTAGTFRETNRQIIEIGFKKIIYFIGQGIYAQTTKDIPDKINIDKIVSRLTYFPQVTQIFVTNSIHQPDQITKLDKITVLDSSPLFADKIFELLKN